MPLIFSLPFLEINDVVCDHKNRTCIVHDRNLNYNPLKPVLKHETPLPKLKLHEQILRNKNFKRDTLLELLHIFPSKWKDHLLPHSPSPPISKTSFLASVLHHIQTLEIENSMENLETNL